MNDTLASTRTALGMIQQLRDTEGPVDIEALLARVEFADNPVAELINLLVAALDAARFAFDEIDRPYCGEVDSTAELATRLAARSTNSKGGMNR